MKLPKNPFQRKVEKPEDINNNIEAENPESINTYSDHIDTGNPDSESESPDSKNTDTKITDTEDIEAIIKKLLNRVKPSLVSFFFLIIAEFFKVPRIISIPICVVINYFGYFVIIPKANEVIVIERLGVTREKLLERQMHTSITSSTDSSKNPFRRLIFMLPFIDKIINTVSLAHTHYDMPPYEAKTNGGTKVWLNSYALIEVTNPSHFTYRIKNVESLIHESTKTQIIDLAADMKLEEIRENIEKMNEKLAKKT